MAMVITGTGSYLPSRIVDNHELEATTTDFDRARAECTLHDWVAGRIGVHTRHRVAEGEGTAAMATHACRQALDDAELTGADIDLIVLSTFTSDHRLPQSISLVQYELGSTAKCIQIEAACAGFVDGLAVAGRFGGLGRHGIRGEGLDDGRGGQVRRFWLQGHTAIRAVSG